MGDYGGTKSVIVDRRVDVVHFFSSIMAVITVSVAGSDLHNCRQGLELFSDFEDEIDVRGNEFMVKSVV